jgi:uncharacterized membrane protein
MFNIFIGIIWQIALVALPIYIVLLNNKGWIITLAIVVITTTILKKTWWDKLEDN